MTLNRSFIYLKTAYNSDGLINCLRQPGLLLNLPPKSTRLNLNPLIQTCGTLTVSSPGTKSIGLPADALVPCFLLAIWTILSWPKARSHHPDLVPSRQYIVTQNLSSTYRDWQKTRHPDTLR